MKLAAALLAVFLAGCITSSAPEATDSGVAERTPGLIAEAPELNVGDAWVFEADGIYYTRDRYTVVVAESGPAGALFAGESPEDLAGQIIWGLYWYGERTRNVGHLIDGIEWGKRFDFPLADGKTWTYAWPSWEQNVTVVQELIRGPNGVEEGFRMSMTSAAGATNFWTYLPSAKTFGEMGHTTADGSTTISLRLVEVTQRDVWLWYEDHDLIFTPPYPDVEGNFLPASLQELHVGPQHDSVVVHAATWDGGRLDITGPAWPDGHWMYTNTGPEKWTQAVIPATEGTWAVKLDRGSTLEGDGYYGAAAVTWRPGSK